MKENKPKEKQLRRSFTMKDSDYERLSQLAEAKNLSVAKLVQLVLIDFIQSTDKFDPLKRK